MISRVVVSCLPIHKSYIYSEIKLSYYTRIQRSVID